MAGIVLKLSLYGVFRLILPLLPKAYIISTYIVFVIGVITIIYASISTIRTIDVKELIAYSSVCHAAVYLMAVFSNTVPGIEGGIILGLAHGFVSSGLFICVGGVLYDRSSTRLITNYRGMAQIMPLFSVIFFILCLGNCGVPLTLNFIGEFMSLYGVFERQPMFGILASSSIIFSAAYTIFMFNRTAFAGSYSKYFIANIPDLNKREFYMLLTLVLFTVTLGIYPAPILDGLHYSTTTLIYSSVWLACIIPMLKMIYLNKANIKFKSVSLLHTLLVYRDLLQTHLLEIYNFLSCKSYSSPKANTFISLPLQSFSFSTLFELFLSFIRSTINSLSSIIDTPDYSALQQLSLPNQLPLPLSSIHLAFNSMPSILDSSGFFTACLTLACLLLPLIVLSTSRPVMPSLTSDNAEGVGAKEKPILVPDSDGEEPKHTVDIAYMVRDDKTILYDKNQKTGERLKELFPALSARLVQISGIRHGIKFINDKPSAKTTKFGLRLLSETVHTDYDGIQYEGVWVTKPSQVTLLRAGHEMASAHQPIIVGPPHINRFIFIKRQAF